MSRRKLKGKYRVVTVFELSGHQEFLLMAFSSIHDPESSMKKYKNVTFRYPFLSQYSLALLTVVFSDSMFLRNAKKTIKNWKREGLPRLSWSEIRMLRYMVEDTCELLAKQEVEKINAKR